jgi:hypothetical protein
VKKENLPSRTWKELQRSTVSKESYDGFSALVGTWWALRQAKRSEREMIEAVERIVRIQEEIAATRTGEKSSASEADGGEPRSASTSISFFPQRQAPNTDGDGLLKYVVLCALTMVLQPLLTAVLLLAVLWGLWQGVRWLFFVVTTERTTAVCVRCARAVLHPFQRLESFHPTDQGIEGRFTGSYDGGCTGSLHFAAVLNVNH